MSAATGQMAPSFKLKASDLTDISLSDYQGKNVLILFFPLAFTGVCTEELCSMRDNLNVYNDLGAQVLAISVDSPFTLAKFKEENNYNFPLLSDFNKVVSKSYGSFYEDFVLDLKGVSKRSAFVVDKDGTIRYAEVLDSAKDLPNFNAIKDCLQSIS